MSDPLLQLFPEHRTVLALEGLYLNTPMPQPAQGRPFVYSNFVSSLDGRIALPAPGRSSHQVPPAIANARDWRLYQELGAHADILITSARYYRQFAVGEAQDTLPVGSGERFADIRDWRIQHGLKAQPDIAIASASLDLPDAALEAYSDRAIHVLTGEDAPADQVAHLRGLGIKVHFCGPGQSADGTQMVEALGAEGYRRIYVIAGPYVLYSLFQDNALDRLYLTYANTILGGEDFDTFIWGSALTPAQKMQLVSLYFDPAAPADSGQLLGCYDCLPRE
jgi:riboflavin biosynthesis pyrimidine reductase